MVGMIHSRPCSAADWQSVQRVPCLSLYDSWLQPQNWISGKKNGCTDGWMGWFMSMHTYKPYNKKVTCPGLTLFPYGSWDTPQQPRNPELEKQEMKGWLFGTRTKIFLGDISTFIFRLGCKHTTNIHLVVISHFSHSPWYKQILHFYHQHFSVFQFSVSL